MIDKSTEEEYERMIRRYEIISNLSPSEKYKRLEEMGLSKGHIKCIMCAFKWKCKEEEKEEYGEIIKELGDEVRKQPKYTNRFKKIRWEEMIMRCKKIERVGVKEIIMSLYVMFPPRRLEDYAEMEYIEDEEDIGEGNYYIDGRIIFQKYKTHRKYGRQEFKISDELNERMKRYIDEQQIKGGEKLIRFRKNSKGGGNREVNLRRYLQDIFGESVDGIRHAYITWLYRDGANLYNIEEISEKMAHNVRTHLTYLDKDNK